MVDTIIKGTGNSRSIKTVPNIKAMISSLDDLLDLFIDGFPVDIGPLNPTGVQVKGTDLTKANLLTDETAALYGKTGAAVPDEIFSVIAPYLSKIGEKAKIAVGSYVGSGKYGPNNPNNLIFPFNPHVVFVYFDSRNLGIFMCDWLTGTFQDYGYNALFLTSTAQGKLYARKVQNTLYWYSNIGSSADISSQFNSDNTTYYYTAIG